MTEESNSETENTMRLLERIVRRVAEKEKFDVSDLPVTHRDNFRASDRQRPMRCVDERPVVEHLGGQRTGHLNTEYNGIQIPGATPGALDILRRTSNLSEPDARFVVARVAHVDGFTMGAHSDDEHGHVRTVEQLTARKKGCGDQREKADGHLPMYKGSLKKHEIESRPEWLSSQRAPIIPLAGEHTAKIANVNLNPSTTNDNAGGNRRGRPMFNCDLGAAAGPLADSIYEVLQDTGLNKEGHTREEFKERFAENTARNYLQTLAALGAGGRKVHISK